MSQAVSVAIKNLSLTYQGAQKSTLCNVNLTLESAKWSCLLGPSGCGKTSLLRLIAGLIETKHHISGTITCSDKRPISEHIAYMAQQDLLLPWLNVVDNICIKSKLTHGKVSALDKQKALQLLEQFGLANIAQSRPEQLSGGMRQRVALARTLMQETPIVLMDEPFSALDAVNRYKLQNLAAQVLKDRTVLLITHDPQEALRLSDQLFLFDAQNQLTLLKVPNSAPPRAVDATLGEYQQQVLSQMQVQHDKL
ncbi:ABC transporter ATP-binding protein [Gammaproteobacteria bacterium AS21]